MAEPITQAELDRRDRLIAAELLAAANTQAEQRIVAAVESVMTNVTLHLGMSEQVVSARIDTVGERLDGMKWKMLAALVGGQAVAGLMAALVTGRVPVPAEVNEAAATLLRLL